MKNNKSPLEDLQITKHFPELLLESESHPVDSIPDILDCINRAAYKRRIGGATRPAPVRQGKSMDYQVK